MRTHVTRLAPLASLIALLGIAVTIDLTSLLRYRGAVGVDGYYYVLQVSELLNHGQLYYPHKTPFIFFLLSSIASLVGSSVLGIKIGSVLLHAVLTVGTFAVVSQLGNSRWLGFLGGVLAAFSGLHRYMISEFINYLGAIALMVTCGWLALRAIQSKRRVLAIFSLACFLGAIMSHKAVLPICLALVLLMLPVKLMLSARSPWHSIVALLVLVLLFVTPWAVASQSLFELPPLLRAELLNYPALPFSHTGWAEKLMLLIAAPGVLLLTFFQKDIRNSKTCVLLCVLASWSLLVTLNPFLAHSAGWSGIAVRLSGLAYLQVAFLVPGLLWLLLTIRAVSTWYVMSLIAPLVFASFAADRPSGMQPHYMFNREQIISGLPLHVSKLGQSPMIVAEHGTQFVVTFASGIPAQQRLPQNSEGKTVYWLLLGINQEMLDPSMIVLGQSAGGSFIVLVQSDNLKQIAQTISEGGRLRLFGVNRHLYQACVTAGFRRPSGECSRVP
jgi:hypothetical protein